MRRFFQSEIGAAVLWVLCSLVMAALISPWLYQGGKYLAARAAAEDLPGLIEWLGAACGRSRFGRYFDRSMLASALVFLPFLYRRIRLLRAGTEVAENGRAGRLSWRDAVVRIVTGAVISGVILWAMGSLLAACGAFEMKAKPPTTALVVSRVLLPAVGASLLEEWLFRGVLLGLWLRFAKPVTACIGTSLLFAFLHFIDPPPGTVIGDPSHPLAGFQLLGKILFHFSDPLFFVTDFFTLFAVGLILAWARLRTGSLWFGIGLHAGWILAFKGNNLIYQNAGSSALRPWFVGDDLRSGILPLAALAITALMCRFAMRRFPRRPV